MASKGMLRDRARGMRKQPSQAERMLWKLLRDRQWFDAKFRRQHLIKPYIADFACVSAMLIIEVDGRSHDDAEAVHYDAERTKALQALGWRVLRVRDDEVLTDPDAVVGRIVAILRAAPSP